MPERRHRYWWHEEGRVARLGELIDQGLGVDAIAREMGTTRGAVAGIAGRLGWAVGRPRRPDQKTVPTRYLGRPKRKPHPYRIRLEVVIEPSLREEIRLHAKVNRMTYSDATRNLLDLGLGSGGQNKLLRAAKAALAHLEALTHEGEDALDLLEEAVEEAEA